MEHLERLVKKAIVGDVGAYSAIIERTQDMAYGYAFSILGDFHHAEDAAQEAFIEAYQCLPKLNEPKAFLSWFRKIVFKHCDRQLRKPKLPVSTLADGCPIQSNHAEPPQTIEAKELRHQVSKAVFQLPQKQREVTALFYINGYSYGDIASFLDVPVTTVKKRLYDSRKTLRERMIDMVENGLKHNSPDQHFADVVVAELLSRPKLLEIDSHSLRDAVKAVCAEFPDYEYVEGSEFIDEADLLWISSKPENLYQTKDGKYLRPETTTATYNAVMGRTPPVYLVTAGRCFRKEKEDALHLKVFHQVDAICIRPDVSADDMKTAVERAVRCIAGEFPMRWVDADYSYLVECGELEVKYKGEWLNVAGSGMLSEKMLADAGFDPARVSGFAYGLGLERLAAIKLGISDIRQLWQHPYV